MQILTFRIFQDLCPLGYDILQQYTKFCAVLTIQRRENFEILNAGKTDRYGILLRGFNSPFYRPSQAGVKNASKVITRMNQAKPRDTCPSSNSYLPVQYVLSEYIHIFRNTIRTKFPPICRTQQILIFVRIFSSNMSWKKIDWIYGQNMVNITVKITLFHLFLQNNLIINKILYSYFKDVIF